jgi:hypothetical protein
MQACGATSRTFVQKITPRGSKHMSYRTPAIAIAIAIALAVCTVSAAAIFAQSPADQSVLTRSRYLPQCAPAGELKLPENSIWRDWIFVGAPLTLTHLIVAKPTSLGTTTSTWSRGHTRSIGRRAYSPREHFFKELLLTKGSSENPDGSRAEPSGRGYSRASSTGRTQLSRIRSGLPTAGAGGSSISIIASRTLRPPRSKINRNARFAILAAPRETRFGRSSSAYWTRSLFPRLAEADELSSA